MKICMDHFEHGLEVFGTHMIRYIDVRQSHIFLRKGLSFN